MPDYADQLHPSHWASATGLLSQRTGQGAFQLPCEGAFIRVRPMYMTRGRHAHPAQVLRTDLPNSSPSVMLLLENARYTFNCGESMQRLFCENRIRISKARDPALLILRSELTWVPSCARRMSTSSRASRQRRWQVFRVRTRVLAHAHSASLARAGTKIVLVAGIIMGTPVMESVALQQQTPIKLTGKAM
jgi:hypothetical protein